MQRRGWRVALVCVGILGLTACTPSNDLKTGTPTASVSAPVISTTSSPSPAVPSVPADVPVTGHNLKYKGETPPVMPVLATQHTSAGGVAFAKFFLQTEDWGYATSNPAYMKHYYADSCTDCKDVAVFLQSAIDKNAYYRGGRLTIVSASVGSRVSPVKADMSVEFITDLTPYDVVDSSGRTLMFGPATVNAGKVVWIRWLGSSWTVVWSANVV